MDTIKNVIETVVVDGKELAIERQSGNVWVNLTQMAKPFGKKVNDWIRLSSTQEFLMVARNKSKSVAGIPATDKMAEDVVFTKQGGMPEDQGTWCTDYHIAIMFAMWLSPEFSWQVSDLMIKLINGEKIVADVLPFDGQNYISQSDYCRLLNRNQHSFFGLKGHYPTAYIYIYGMWYISMKMYRMKESEFRIKEVKDDFRKEKDKRQLEFDFQ